jgi:hypothetical protein
VLTNEKGQQDYNHDGSSLTSYLVCNSHMRDDSDESLLMLAECFLRKHKNESLDSEGRIRQEVHLKPQMMIMYGSDGSGMAVMALKLQLHEPFFCVSGKFYWSVRLGILKKIKLANDLDRTGSAGTMLYTT